MSETKKDKQLFTVGRVFFLLIVIPLSLVALLIANGILKLGETAREQAVTVLDKKSQEDIKQRAINVAEEVADFLSDREKDILIATILPATETAYKEFVLKSEKSLWTMKNGEVSKIAVPVYSEMSLIGRNGNEIIKIAEGQAIPKSKLVNVANPENTTYKSEDYFAKAKTLNKGEIYVSPVTGWYVNRQDFAKGKRFAGILRFATPLFDQQGFAGVISMAVDIRHLMRFTDNIVPTQSGYVVEAEAATGNYAFMVDNRGFIISSPNDYNIVGLYPDGKQVPALTETTAETLLKREEEVLNVYQMGYIDPTLPLIAKDAAAGNDGMKTYQSGTQTLFTAYAPIRFYCATYPKPGGFGWIGMTVDTGKFKELALSSAKKIQQEAQSWIATIIVIIVISVILLFLIVALLARGMSRSIEAEVPEGSQEGVEFYDDEDDED
ncbi:MAG: cache domain-containing protein [Deltaproteobacteria bacterium]|nr:cache domain-containing protein [Deltaproteobacteria bacterium]